MWRRLPPCTLWSACLLCEAVRMKLGPWLQRATQQPTFSRARPCGPLQLPILLQRHCRVPPLLSPPAPLKTTMSKLRGATGPAAATTNVRGLHADHRGRAPSPAGLCEAFPVDLADLSSVHELAVILLPARPPPPSASCLRPGGAASPGPAAPKDWVGGPPCESKTEDERGKELKGERSEGEQE